jgi:lipid-binding SYLF domain-containing protein
MIVRKRKEDEMHREIHTFPCILFAAVLTVLVFGQPGKALSAEMTDEQILVEKARVTFLSFMADEGLHGFRDSFKRAKGILIIPEMLKGGFFLGGSGGSGVFLARDEEKGDWSPPAFYTIGSLTLGIQIGGEISGLIMLAQTDKGMQSLYSSSFKLGGDASAAAGPVGVAGKVDMLTDFLTYGRSQGAYVGVNLESAVIATRDAWNRAYYGKDVRPVEILRVRSVRNPGADELREALQKAFSGLAR